MDVLTDRSLLGALQSLSQSRRDAAWATFEAHYRPLIDQWCRQQGLAKGASEELTQDVLIKLFEKFPRQCYDPDRGRFRAWLRTFVRNCLADHFRDRKRQHDAAVGGTDHHFLLVELPGHESADQLSDLITEQPLTREVRALVRVQARVAQAHWDAFCHYHLSGRPVAEVAKVLGLGEWNVRKVLQRIKRLIEEEIKHG